MAIDFGWDGNRYPGIDPERYYTVLGSQWIRSHCLKQKKNWSHQTEAQSTVLWFQIMELLNTLAKTFQSPIHWSARTFPGPTHVSTVCMLAAFCTLVHLCKLKVCSEFYLVLNNWQRATIIENPFVFVSVMILQTAIWSVKSAVQENMVIDLLDAKAFGGPLLLLL